MIQDYFRPVRHKFPLDYAIEIIGELSGKSDRQCRKLLEERIWPNNPALKKLEPAPGRHRPQPKLLVEDLVGPRHERLWEAFRGRPFTLGESIGMLQLSSTACHWTIAHLTKRGLAERLKRGTYRLIADPCRTEQHGEIPGKIDPLLPRV